MKEMIEQDSLPEVAHEQVELNEQERVGRWKAYAKYKNSGVEWLGEIPVHWEVRRLKFVTIMNSEVLSENTSPDYILQYVDIGNVDSEGKITDVKEMPFSNAPSRARRLVKHNDIIISTVRTYLKAISHIENPPDNLVVSTGFAVLRPHSECNAKFLWRLLQSNEFVHTIVSYSQGVSYPAITPSNLSSLPIWFPPLLEQHAIASFLDRKTIKVNNLIAKKERHIALLQEQRIALINQAVTKGLNTDVPMKDSGVEWLGQIPEHWSYRQFKHIAAISYGLTLELDRTETEGTCILSLPNLTKDGQLILHDVPLTPLTPQEKTHLLLRKGDLLFNWRNGSLDHVGKTAYFNADGEYTHVSFLLRVRFDTEQYEPRYYHMFLNNLRSTGFFSASKSRINNTYNQAELKRLEVIVPPLKEQKAIAAYLEQETIKIDKLITRIQESIKKLKEYSTALISAAVTGKIDVRGEA